MLKLVWLVAGAGGLSALMGEKWKQLTPEQRAPYKRMRDAQPGVAAALEARALEEKACAEARQKALEEAAKRAAQPSKLVKQESYHDRHKEAKGPKTQSAPAEPWHRARRSGAELLFHV